MQPQTETTPAPAHMPVKRHQQPVTPTIVDEWQELRRDVMVFLRDHEREAK